MANGNTPNLVITRTPMRISFAGGGTDLPEFYKVEKGAVLSTAIDKYVYVTVKRHGTLHNETYRLNYAETEHAQELDDVKNEIARECLRLVPVEAPLYISTVGDVPASSGLGSSSSFSVGLLNALHALRGEAVSPAQLLDEAVTVEIDMLGHPIGKQDQAAAAYGGFNCFRFDTDGTVQLEPHSPLQTNFANLFDHFQMFWTGISRDSASVLEEQKRNTPGQMDHLRQMCDQAEQLNKRVRKDLNIESFGQTLDQGWQLKRSLASNITNNTIDAWYQAALDAGAIGGKICGAGGGGFLLFVTPLEHHENVRRALSDLKELPLNYEPRGSVRLLVN